MPDLFAANESYFVANKRLSFVARYPGVAYPIGNGIIAEDGSISYKASEGCEDDQPMLYVGCLVRVFDIVPKGSFLIVSEAVPDDGK